MKNFAFLISPPGVGVKIYSFVIVENVENVGEARSLVASQLGSRDFEVLEQYELAPSNEPTYTQVGLHECNH